MASHQKHKAKAKHARGLEERVLLNIANGFKAGWNSQLSKERIAKTVQSCIDKGWLFTVAKNIGLTEEGKHAAGLVLREVPLPKHLTNLIRNSRS